MAEVSPTKRKVEGISGDADNKAQGQSSNPPTVKMPQKKYYRQRAHCNPLSFSDSFDYPADPSSFDYKSHYPVLATKVRHSASFRVLSAWCTHPYECVCCIG